MLLQISAALEYSVASVPSLIWETEAGGGKLYLGGYKAAVNLRWLAASNTSLIVNTARGLEAVLGPRYRRQLEARAAACPGGGGPQPPAGRRPRAEAGPGAAGRGARPRGG